MRIEGTSGHKLTIAHLMPWRGIGGVEISTMRLTRVMREQFRSVAFCLRDAIELRESFEKLEIETITYAPPTPSLRHAARYYKESLVLARQLQQAGVDIVHFTDLKAACHNSLAALLANCHTVCHIRSVYKHLDLRDRCCLLPVQNFIFVSKEARRSFALSLSDLKARVIHNPIELPATEIAESPTDIRRELGVPSGCIVVGMVARVAPVKDYFTLASAAVEILHKYPNTRFLVVGDNSRVELNRNHYSEIIRKLTELGIADKFIFTGHRSDVLRMIAAMDISVLCSHREGFGLCIVESMAMRKPVVATAVGGIPEIIVHGVTGYLHQHGNSRELADAIISLIENPEEASRLGMAGYDRARQNFSPTAFADAISRTYSDAMHR